MAAIKLQSLEFSIFHLFSSKIKKVERLSKGLGVIECKSFIDCMFSLHMNQ